MYQFYTYQFSVSIDSKRREFVHIILGIYCVYTIAKSEMFRVLRKKMNVSILYLSIPGIKSIAREGKSFIIKVSSNPSSTAAFV